MIKRVLAWLMAAAMSVNLSGCDNKPRELPTLRLGFEQQDHHAPLFVAAMNPDYFKAHGGTYLKEVAPGKEYQLVARDRPIAKVLLEANTGGDELARRLAENQLDLSFGGVPAFLKHIDGGRPIHMIAPVNAEGAGLVARKDLPAEDWDGFVAYVKGRKEPLKIGYKAAVTTQNLIFETALADAGIRFSTSLEDSRAQVVLLNLNGAKNLLPAMENGLIDGYVIQQPHPAVAETQGKGKVISQLRDLPPAGKWHGHPCCILAANDAFTRSQPEVARELVGLLLRAQRFIHDQPERSVPQIAQWLGNQPAVEARSIPTIDYRVGLGDNWNRGVNFWVDEMVRSGRLKGKVRDARQAGNLEALIYDRNLYLEAGKRAE